MEAAHRLTLGAITPRDWQAVLRAARELDLDRGGYWDGRSGAVNAWCGPDDRPTGWPEEVPIRCGALRHPRAFVASCWLEWPKDEPADGNSEDHLPVVAEITCYEVREHFGWRHSGRVRGDQAWLKRHWRELVAVARTHLPRPLQLELGGLQGPACAVAATCGASSGCCRRRGRTAWATGGTGAHAARS
jgi:hypothetical protein